MDETTAVVTGVGFACPQGIGSTDVFDRFVEGENAIRDERFGYPVALVRELDAEAVMGGRKAARRADRATQLAAAAAAVAAEHADLDVDVVDADRAGVSMGTGAGGLSTAIENHTVLLEKGFDRVSPMMVPMFMSNAPAGEVSQRYGLRGPNVTFATACASGSHAVGDAIDQIRAGRADVMLAGGTEAVAFDLPMAGFARVGALSRTGSRPFAADRDGFVMGEGAAVLVIESATHAAARGARTLAIAAGHGRSADAYHVTAPAPDGAGARLAIERCLADSRLSTDDVDYVNAHGTSTPLNDAAEAAALHAVFGASPPPTSSVKSMIGHLIGAAGAVEAAVTVLALASGILPPTINHVNPDPEIALDVVPNSAREAEGMRAAISNSFGFGGVNAVVAFRALP
ncbi:MAG: beta-ketoacyl-ACP synthase II [Acidimicrobiia bacterium]